MKKTLVICTLLAAVTASHAQSTSGEQPGWDLLDHNLDAKHQARKNACYKWERKRATLQSANLYCRFAGTTDPLTSVIAQWEERNCGVLIYDMQYPISLEVQKNIAKQATGLSDQQFCTMMWDYRQNVLRESSAIQKPAPRYKE